MGFQSLLEGFQKKCVGFPWDSIGIPLGFYSAGIPKKKARDSNWDSTKKKKA